MERFTIDNDVVIDNNTGLIWQKNHAENLAWDEAIEYAKNLKCGVFIDWRLPTVEELGTIIDVTKCNPASDFPDVPQKAFWSCTPANICGHEYAKFVGFGDGFTSDGFKGYTCYVRCVSSGVREKLTVTKKQKKTKPLTV